MALSFFRDYQELFSGCIGLYDLAPRSISGTTLYNIINSGTYDGTIAKCSYGTDRFGIASNALQATASGYDATSGVVISKYAEPIGAKTILMWVKMPSSASDIVIYDTIADSSTKIGNALTITAAGYLRIDMGKGTTGVWNLQLSGAVNLCDGTYKLVGFSWDGTTGSNKVNLIVNGAIVVSGTAAATESEARSYDIRLFGYYGGVSYGLTGFPINAMCIWNRQLSISELSEFYRLSLSKTLYPVQPGVRSCL